MSKTSFHFHAFADLRPLELYELLKLRQDIFIIEQQCIYPELDGLDPHCQHLLARDSHRQLIGVSRIVPPGLKDELAHIGRLVVDASVRGQGLGQQLVEQAKSRIALDYPGVGVALSAQHHLQDFYRRLGFEVMGEPYDDAGILHVDMLLK